jgi:hypothetical protein
MRMSLQELYNLEVEKALDGTMPAISAGFFKCFYDDGMGHRCAIGVGIPPEKDVKRIFDGVHDLPLDLLENFPAELDRYALSELQCCHDTCAQYARGNQEIFIQKFLNAINQLPFFSFVEKVDPTTLSAACLSKSTSPPSAT